MFLVLVSGKCCKSLFFDLRGYRTVDRREGTPLLTLPIVAAGWAREKGRKLTHRLLVAGGLDGFTEGFDSVSYTHLTLPTNREV